MQWSNFGKVSQSSTTMVFHKNIVLQTLNHPSKWNRSLVVRGKQVLGTSEWCKIIYFLPENVAKVQKVVELRYFTVCDKNYLFCAFSGTYDGCRSYVPKSRTEKSKLEYMSNL
jgi:hypothetical protein